MPVRYRSPEEDSARWIGFPFRQDDIVEDLAVADSIELCLCTKAQLDYSAWFPGPGAARRQSAE
jgi:hypothetical protein